MLILVNTFLLVDVSTFNGLFNGSVNNIGQAGADNCASGLALPTYWTVQTQNRSQNGYLGLDYELNDKTQLFADF